MNYSGSVSTIIAGLTSASKSLSLEEREQLRSELLAMALFDHNNPVSEEPAKPDNTMKDLTEQERELIRKLAEKTEFLWQLGMDPGLDQ